jgi:type II secretory pathway component PulF
MSAAPAPNPSPARRRAVTLLAALPWPVVLFEFLAVLPRYDRVFRQFGLKVDDFTAVILNVSAWVQRNVLAAFAIAFALMAVSVLTAHTVQADELPRNRRAAMLLIVFGVPCLVFGMTWLGVLNTHRTLVEGLRK